VPHRYTLPNIYICGRIKGTDLHDAANRCKNVTGIRSTFCQCTYNECTVAPWCSRCGDTVCSFLQVHLRSHFIMNGVCVRWRGWVDLERLDGVGCLEYDEDKAQVLSQLFIYRAVFLKHFCSLPVGIAALRTLKTKGKSRRLAHVQCRRSSSSSSSSYICHGFGSLVDPFRSHVFRSLFKGLPCFLLPVGE
jgi:hypothetical protein